MEREHVDFKTTLAWINADGYEMEVMKMEVIKMTRERLEFKTMLTRIDKGVDGWELYDILSEGFKGYQNFSDSELVEEYFNLTGKVVEIKESV